MRVLVTGHDGYVGSVMVPVLQEAGHEVVGLDTGFFTDSRFLQAPTLPKGRGKSTPAGRGAGVVSHRKDIRDITAGDLHGIEAVVHLAALCNDPLGNLNEAWTAEINHAASVSLARLAKAAGIQRFLFASSCSIYGASGGNSPLTEEAPLDPLTPYAQSKIQTEADLIELADSGFSPVLMRNATAYGVSPRLRADLVLNNLVGWAWTTGKVKILSDGTAWRPLVHVEDIAGAFAAALGAPRQAVHAQAFNVGAQGENYQVRTLAEIVRETVPGCEIELAGQATHDPRNYQVDFHKLETALPGFYPRWTARSGAWQLYLAYRAAGLSLEDFESRKYSRLKQLEYLIDRGQLDETLRWNTADAPAARPAQAA
ncbi:MAG TPA: NAD(P)-dependent oxidoreductase [Candidatus Dormibacteraeota bacterium]|nr:NAD(P)-dependent oxidoreductase [Candidatus Dormibacteraeota bacterium]